MFHLMQIVECSEREQEESKKQAADEIIGYADTFAKLGFTGLSMKDSTPHEIAAVVGTLRAYIFSNFSFIIGLRE